MSGGSILVQTVLPPTGVVLGGQQAQSNKLQLIDFLCKPSDEVLKQWYSNCGRGRIVKEGQEKLA